jgi:hypothetical protein
VSSILSSPLEVSIDIPGYGRSYFQLGAPVRPSLVSVFPQKIVTGDYNRDTEQIASNHIMEDLTGGALILREVPSEQFDRFWDSTLNTLYKLQLTLPFNPVDTGAPSDAGVNSQVRASAVLNGGLFAAWDAKVAAFNSSTNLWGASLHTLGSTATDAIYYAGKIYFAYHTGYSTFDGTSWVDTATPVDYFTTWDGKLWFISNDGTNFRNYDTTTNTSTAGPSLIDGDVWPGDVKGLTTFYDYFGSQDVYAITKTGPFLFDATSRKWLRVPANMPRQQWGGAGFTTYRNTLYMSSGTSVYQYTGGALSPMGLDRDWGLPSYLQGHISKMASTPAFLTALLDSTVSTPSAGYSVTNEFETAMFPNFASSVVFPTRGYVSAWVWNDKGWHHLFRTSNTGTGGTWLFMGDTFNDQRLWIGANGKAYYIRLPDGIVNPLQVPGLPYGPNGYLVLPWFDGGWSDLDKLAIRLRLKVSQITSTETIVLSYAINDSNHFTPLLTINKDTPTVGGGTLGSRNVPGTGYVEVYWSPDFTNGDELVTGGPGQFSPGAGMVFKNIQFKVDMQRGTDVSKTPVLQYMTLKYQKVLDPLYGYSLSIVLEQPYRGRSVQQQAAALEAAVANKPLMEFRYRDLEGIDQVRWVRVSRAASSNYGGSDQRGRWDLSLIEE